VHLNLSLVSSFSSATLTWFGAIMLYVYSEVLHLMCS
jgi:hypothetical protein